jgi:hypothetical protein
MVNLDEIVEINGEPMRIGDVPFPDSLLWFGHPSLTPGEEWRTVQPGNWPYTPQTCLVANEGTSNTWNADGTILACNGCGLDVT